MVQLANSARLDRIISFGAYKAILNQNNMPVQKFVPSFKCWAGAWQLSTTQLLQVAGMDKKFTDVYVVPHRINWDGITCAQINGSLYDVGTVAKDSFNSPTSYDLVTIGDVVKHG